MALQPDGKILLAGGTTSYPSSFALMRLEANGSADSGFGNAGAVTQRTSTSTTGAGDVGYAIALRPGDGAESVVVQPDGKIVMGVYATPSSNDGYGLARVHP